MVAKTVNILNTTELSTPKLTKVVNFMLCIFLSQLKIKVKWEGNLLHKQVSCPWRVTNILIRSLDDVLFIRSALDPLQRTGPKKRKYFHEEKMQQGIVPSEPLFRQKISSRDRILEKGEVIFRERCLGVRLIGWERWSLDELGTGGFFRGSL